MHSTQTSKLNRNQYIWFLYIFPRIGYLNLDYFA